MTGFHPSEW